MAKKKATKKAAHSAAVAMSERVTGSLDTANPLSCSRQNQDTTAPMSVLCQFLKILLVMAAVSVASEGLAWALSLVQPYLSAEVMAAKISIAITLLAMPVISKFIPFLFPNDGGALAATEVVADGACHA